MIDPFDDLGTARKPFKVVACVPVFGRSPLLYQTIRRLIQKNDVYKVICVGDQHEDRKICEAAGAHWVQFRNKPLGKKWNAAFTEARQFFPDACLYVGSSDWLSDPWIDVMQPYVEKYHLTGTLGMHLLHIDSSYRACYWPGYTNNRKGETIGIGRLLSAELLDKLHWKPFMDFLDNSLDRSMNDRAASYNIFNHDVKDFRLKSLSLSTNRWTNKHSFEQHWNNMLPSEKISNVKEFLDQNFPEAWDIFKDTSVRV